MNKKAITLLILGALTSGSIYAADTTYSYTQYVTDTTTVIDNATKQSKEIYTINGIPVPLTDKDKIKAKAWNLTEAEYAKYQYIMEYTPRGLWTPDLDPPIVLGNNAETEKERLHFAKIMNDIEMNRRYREGTFQLAGIQDIDNRLNGIGNDEKKVQPKGSFSQNLPEGKYVLRSLFVDMKTCEQECQNWVLKQMLIVGDKVQMDVYLANAENITDAKVYETLHVKPMKVLKGDINIRRSTKQFEIYSKGWKSPFVIQRDDTETKRYGLFGNTVNENQQ